MDALVGHVCECMRSPCGIMNACMQPMPLPLGLQCLCRQFQPFDNIGAPHASALHALSYPVIHPTRRSKPQNPCLSQVHHNANNGPASACGSKAAHCQQQGSGCYCPIAAATSSHAAELLRRRCFTHCGSSGAAALPRGDRSAMLCSSCGSGGPRHVRPRPAATNEEHHRSNRCCCCRWPPAALANATALSAE
jgi:hypothetical protein